MDSKRPTGVMIFSIINIIAGIAFLFIFFIPFFFGVIFGWVTDREFYGYLDWFCLVILDRLAWAIFYIFSFLLFYSGIAMLRMKPYSRKLAMLASGAIISSDVFFLSTTIIKSIVYPKVSLDIQSPWSIILAIFLIYTILLITYLMRPEVKRDFNDENVKLPLKDFAFVIFIFFILPLFWQLIHMFFRR